MHERQPENVSVEEKRQEHKQRLNTIQKASDEGKKLSKDDLRFLYELGSTIHLEKFFFESLQERHSNDEYLVALLQAAACDQQVTIRIAAANAMKWHPELYVETLQKLAEDEAYDVRRAAVNAVEFDPKLLAETLQKLATDEDWGVRVIVAHAMATRPEQFVDFIECLAKDGNGEVRLAAREAMRTSPDLFSTFQ